MAAEGTSAEKEVSNVHATDILSKGIVQEPSLLFPTSILDVNNNKETNWSPNVGNIDYGVNIKTSTSCSHIDVPENINSVVGTLHETPICPSFNIGCNNSPLKKPVKLKKKRNRDSIKVIRPSIRSDEGVTKDDQSEWAGKSKTYDMDVIMEDNEVLMKKPCMQLDVSSVSQDIVAEVGQPQPREQQ
ncbi:unnamed protein product [Amaranthus hypochondriacus]